MRGPVTTSYLCSRDLRPEAVIKISPLAIYAQRMNWTETRYEEVDDDANYQTGETVIETNDSPHLQTAYAYLGNQCETRPFDRGLHLPLLVHQPQDSANASCLEMLLERKSCHGEGIGIDSVHTSITSSLRDLCLDE